MLCFHVMVRWLVLIVILAAVNARAEVLYLSRSEKAVLSLGLQAAILQGDDSEYLIKNLMARVRYLQAQPRSSVEVNSFDQYMEHQKSESVFGQNKLEHLETDKLFELMPDPIYFSRSERVQKKINQYESEKAAFTQNLTLSALGLSAAFVAKSDQLSKDDLRQFVKEKADAYINNFIGKMTQGTKSTYVHILAKLLKSYFELLPDTQKAEIVYRLIQLPLKPTSAEVFSAMIQSTGPQMQKLIQIIGRNPAIPEEFRTIFQKLESQVLPVPWKQIKLIADSEGILDDYSYFERSALGVGTMAQTHRAQRKGMAANARTFVVRFLKPGIEQLLEMDHKILIKISQEIDTDPEFKQYKLPSLRKQVEDVHASVVEELDIAVTVENQKRAKQIYETELPISFSNQKNILQVHVPDTWLIGKNKKIMQQEIVFGRKIGSEFSTYAEQYPELYPVVAQALTEHWLDQAFFKSGFFHADLHHGNMLVNVSDDRIQVNFLDFGMVGQLSEAQRDNVLLLAVGLKLNNANLIAESFSNLTRSPMGAYQKQNFVTDVEERLEKIKSGEETHTTFEQWAAWALTKGIDLHYEFVKLNRGIMAISSLLEESKNPLNFESVAFNVVLRNKTKMLSVLAKQKHVNYLEILSYGYSNVILSKPAKASCSDLF